MTKKNKKTHKSKHNNSKLKKTIITIIAIFLVIAVGVGIFFIKDVVNNKTFKYDFGKDVASGIDVSEFNKNIDWEIVKDNVDFAFIRVAYMGYGTGKIVEDKKARENLEGAINAGIPVGAYFYSQAINEKEARKEAKFIYKIIKKYNVTLPIIIDYEYAEENENKVGRLYEANLTSDEATNVINAFCTYINGKGYPAGVYASSSLLNDKIAPSKFKNVNLVWTADYNEKVTYNIRYNVWQYSSKGKINGIKKKVDLNYWYK